MSYNYGLFPIKTQKVTSSGSSAATTDGMLAHTQFIRIVASADCHVAFGGSPTATASGMFLPAKDIEIIKIRPGEKVAVIGSVDLYVTELSG
jgi:hypothetical protein|tara:strand:+ start:190 stop:465 length:276 start_codon:yes stop_codon:yes gene_type:complete